MLRLTKIDPGRELRRAAVLNREMGRHQERENLEMRRNHGDGNKWQKV